MTKINKIICHGFKSFAKHTEFIFNDKFNCVLGPNGSGKSNLLDGICFVLGKSSSKSLRAEKAANLIYNGGKEKNPATRAEVSIFFDNTKKVFPTPDPEVKISRIVKQNGQSTYRINDQKVTRQQILDVLSAAKIDPDGYNIILQGDIVNFVNMPPMQRRELIDEISGITLYEEKKHKAELELTKVEEKLKEAEIILTERGTYLKELKDERNQALKFKEAQDKIKENKASFLKLQIDKKEKGKQSLQEKIDEHKKQMGKVSEKVKASRDVNLAKKQEIEALTREVEEKGEKDQVNITKEIETIKIELAKKTTKIDGLKNEIIKIKKRKEELSNDAQDIEKRIEAVKISIHDLEESRKGIQKEKIELEKKIDGFKKKHNLDTSSTIEIDVEKIDVDIEEKQKRINELREKQQAFLREKDRLEFQMNSFDEQMKKFKEVESEHKSQIDDLKKKREELQKMMITVNRMLDEDAQLARSVAEERKMVMDLEQELSKLSAKNMQIREGSLQKFAVKKVLEQKKKMQGIYGTIAELGSVSSKYALALETAAGPRLHSIVVEDDKVAASLIKYLKQQKIGLATFLPLNKLQVKPLLDDVKSLLKLKGVVGHALDLVEYDKKFEKAFEYVFQNTLVVETIDTARAVGIGKVRMATVDGDLAELSGAMHGGFRKRKESFGFEEKELTKEIEKKEHVLEEAKANIGKLEKTRMRQEELLVKAREQKAMLEGEIIKTEKSLHLDDADFEASSLRKEELRKLVVETEKSLERTKNEIIAFNKDLTALKAAKQDLRTKISELRNPRLLAELNTFEQKRNDFTEELINMQNELKNGDNELKNLLLPEKEKIHAIMKQHGQEEKEFDSLIESLMKEVKEMNVDLKKKEEEAVKFFARFKQLFQKRSKLNEEIQQEEIEINKKLDDTRDIELKMNTLSLEMARLNAEMAGLLQEFEQYRDVHLVLNKSEEEYKRDIVKFEKMLNMMGSINMKALEIYETVEKEYKSLLEKKVILESEKGDILGLMAEIEAKKKDLFMNSFDGVNKHFQGVFSQLTTKGVATLELEDPENPFAAGLNVKVKISANKYLDIKSLSGGEKTLTALAFIFAIQESDPASFYVLDEVDAALDKRNSEKLAKLIRKYADHAQYVIISHNDSIISEADALFGVSMNEHGVSNVVSLKI